MMTILTGLSVEKPIWFTVIKTKGESKMTDTFVCVRCNKQLKTVEGWASDIYFDPQHSDAPVCFDCIKHGESPAPLCMCPCKKCREERISKS